MRAYRRFPSLSWVLALGLALPLPSFGQTQAGLGDLQVDMRSGSRNVSEQAVGSEALQAATDGHADANDFYYYQGERLPLHRSRTEGVVQFAEDLDEASTHKKARTLSLPGSLSRAGQVRGRKLSIIKFENARRQAEVDGALDELRADPGVKFAFPVFIHPHTGTKMLLTDEIVVKLNPGQRVEDLLGHQAASGLAMVKQIMGTEDEYVLQVEDATKTPPLDIANALVDSGLVEWATPNFVQEYQRFFLPNDPGFNQQWHLHNTGQGRGNPAADVDAPEAWELERGSADIVIAIIDNGVQIEHPDLATNIFTNPREIPGNGIDDDGNGYVDDVHGWDFAADDNDPRPSAPDDNHGTAVAGVAAAVGNNGIGVSGVCPNCKILPVKINFVSDAKLAEAIRYAASLADVLNNSWGGGAPSPVIQSAIRDATTTGRGGKGAVVLFAAGNSASGHQPMMLRGLPAGTHRFIWEYLKDGSVNAGDDTAWLAWVVFPGGTWVDLRNPLPGWRTGGHALWALVHDPAHTDEGLCLTRAAKAGRITHGQRTFLEVVKQVPAGDFVSMAWVSSEGGYDGLVMAVDLFNDGWIDGYVVRSGVPRVTPRVSYPAAHPEAIAVGASTNFDCRAAYSQFGPELDFVAPSNGGPTNPINLGIVTTDRTGSAGYDSQSDYTTGFGGTSSATPLAAGVVGLMLSHHPNLPQEEVRRILHQTANKIGPEPYDVTGRNDRYGFGRINAFKAVAAAAEAVAVPPGVATLLAPLDGMTNATPTYTWAAVPGAERYHLWVSDSTGKRISQRYRAEQAGCADGSGTCSVTSDVVLAEGAGRWQVRALNGVSTGPWSTPRQFTVQAQ